MRRLITALGVKPVAEHQWKFKYFWLYGAVEPDTGQSVFLQFTHADSICFEQFLAYLAALFPDDWLIVQVDQASFHRSKALKLPDNVVLLFQPPLCPELNPIERVWQHIKQFLALALFDNLDQLQDEVDTILDSLSPATIASLTDYDFIIDALSVAFL